MAFINGIQNGILGNNNELLIDTTTWMNLYRHCYTKEARYKRIHAV